MRIILLIRIHITTWWQGERLKGTNMNVSELRIENLRATVAEVGSQSKLAKVVGTNRLYISQILRTYPSRAKLKDKFWSI